MFIVKKDRCNKDKEVELQQRSNGVMFVVNGQVIAKLDDTDDRLILVGGCSKDVTGLRVGYSTHNHEPGHVQTVWDVDQDTSIKREFGE